MTEQPCAVCGIPLDAEYFDVSGLVGTAWRERAITEAIDPFDGFDFKTGETLPRRGEQKVLASFQLHPQYCGILTHFAQYTDLYAHDNSQIRTPGFEWMIVQNGKPLFPYTRLELIVNPWGNNCLAVAVRLEENAKVELVLRNRVVRNEDLEGSRPRYPIRAFAGRLMGRYWYNENFGGRVRSWRD